jgi:acylaminoacyl-peptidase
MIRHKMTTLWAAAPLAGLVMLGTGAVARPISQHDLVMVSRVSDAHISPNGEWVVYDQTRTDLEANKRKHAIYMTATSGKGLPRQLADGTNPRWSADGTRVYFLAPAKDVAQIWSLDPAKPEVAPSQVTSLPIDVDSFRVAADRKTLIISMAVFSDAEDPAATKARLDIKDKGKSSGTLYDKIFIRHWDTWADGRRNHLFALKLNSAGLAGSPAKPLMPGFDGDAPSKPFGDDADYAISPDSKIVYFSARLAGRSEPWSTNFDIYSVPASGTAAPRNLTADNQAWDAAPVPSADGKSLAYLAMKRAGFEADRFGVTLKVPGGAAREADPKWDRSPDKIAWSGDGKSLYALAADLGHQRLFALDVASGDANALTTDGHVGEFDVARASGGDVIVYTHDALDSPAELFAMRAGAAPVQLTHANADALAGVEFSAFEQFSFSGWNNEEMHGFVMKPAGYQAGRKYPTVFIVHGGPQGSFGDGWSYRWNPEVWAGWGYAVVFVDFHGSTGYGQAFTDAISGHWGDRPVEDLQKGWAAAAAKYPFIDTTRAGAAGASYGGYMVYWMAGNWNAPFKCLIAHDGVFDNRIMGYATEELWFSEWENEHATVWQNAAAYERFNPINHVADWTKPMLVIHSAKDYRIPIEQGIAAFNALQRKGVDSEFLTFPDENHWVLKPQNSLQWHDTVEAWLKRWLK